ncbi:hypothetical protein JW905_03665, partial [bacterium]|nr:hypothetical protein [candidate division CSSED10-310 bacterium]
MKARNVMRSNQGVFVLTAAILVMLVLPGGPDQALAAATSANQTGASGLWAADGPFAGFLPQQEILRARTRISKTFDNLDGTMTTFFLGDIHYQDAAEGWLEIDRTIRPLRTPGVSGAAYANLTNRIHTFF